MTELNKDVLIKMFEKAIYLTGRLEQTWTELYMLKLSKEKAEGLI